jgi:hypothetical protein
MKDFISIFNREEPDDFRDMFDSAPRSFADKYPEIPRPAPRLSPGLIAARWASHDLYGEDMPSIAADLLETGYDSPSLRRLAGEMNVGCSADVEDLVAKTFHELSIPYPISEIDARLILSRQIAREVIAGKRNPWAAASHSEFAVWGWRAESPDVQKLYFLRDELDWDAVHRRRVSALTEELIETFARLGAPTTGEKRLAHLGALEGQGWIADDFNAPLPDDLLAAFEGREPDLS